MAGIPRWLYAQLGQAVSIEPYGGVNGSGVETYGTAVSVTAIVEESDSTSRTTAPTGDHEVLATIRCPLATDCPPGSRITLASGLRGTATTVKRWDGGLSPAPSHLEIAISGLHDAE